MASKVLNPHLFSSQDPFMVEDAPQWSIEKENQIAIEKLSLTAQWQEETHRLKVEIENLSRQLTQKDFDSQRRFDKLENHLRISELRQKEFIKENASQMTVLRSQVKFGDTVEEKVKNLLDKHNQNMRTFELKIHQLQLQMREKDEQIRQMQNLIHSYRQELAKLKKI